MSTIIVASLLVLSFFILKPILLSIILGGLLAFIFVPIYKKLDKKINYPTISAAIVCTVFAILLILPLWFFTPTVVEQSFKFYVASQELDIITPLQTIFPSFFASDQFSAEVGSIIQSFITKTTNSLMNSASQLILDFPTLFLHFLVVFFTFFFALRDNKQLVEYIQSLLPFSKDVEKKLFASSRGITYAVLYGQVVIGIAQGLAAGIGFFIFSVPNAFVLTALACIAGIFPIIGTTIVWLPVVIYMLLAGNIFAAIGILIFGVISSSIDNLFKPIFVSKRTNVPSSLILIGMIGGLFFFGILGIILGPLVLSYVLIIIEVYRTRKAPTIFTTDCD